MFGTAQVANNIISIDHDSSYILQNILFLDIRISVTATRNENMSIFKYPELVSIERTSYTIMIEQETGNVGICRISPEDNGYILSTLKLNVGYNYSILGTIVLY